MNKHAVIFVLPFLNWERVDIAYYEAIHSYISKKLPLLNIYFTTTITTFESGVKMKGTIITPRSEITRDYHTIMQDMYSYIHIITKTPPSTNKVDFHGLYVNYVYETRIRMNNIKVKYTWYPYYNDDDITSWIDALSELRIIKDKTYGININHVFKEDQFPLLNYNIVTESDEKSKYTLIPIYKLFLEEYLSGIIIINRLLVEDKKYPWVFYLAVDFRNFLTDLLFDNDTIPVNVINEKLTNNNKIAYDLKYPLTYFINYVKEKTELNLDTLDTQFVLYDGNNPIRFVARHIIKAIINTRMKYSEIEEVFKNIPFKKI